MTRLNIPLFVALAATLLSAIDARDHLPHQRMIRKRGPAPIGHVEARAPAFVVPRWPGLVDRQATDTADTATGSASATRSISSSSASASASASQASSSSAAAAATTTSSASSSSASSSVASSSSASSSASSSSSRSGLLDSLTAVLGGTSTSSSSLALSTSTTSALSSSVVISSSAAPVSTSAVVQPTTQAAATTPQPTLNIATPSPSQTSNPSQSVAVIYSTASAAVAQQSQQAAKEKSAKITRNTIISLVVIASCIGGAIAIWTVIRKWKLSPSERFDDRMQPIDWAPTGGATGMRDDPTNEKTHRRVGSAGSHGSFTSGGVGQSELGHGGAKSIYSDATGHGNGNAQYGAQAQDLPPPHDFTAGTAQYGQYQGQQYAGAGYADLRRGPSVSESTYSHGTYSRGPAYEAQPGAAGVPPLPNPYGGYEHDEYGYQPQAQAQAQGQTQGQGQYRGY